MIKAGCTGKRTFLHFGQAKKAAVKLRREYDDAHVEAYHCEQCGGFHVGERREYGIKDARRSVQIEEES